MKTQLNTYKKCRKSGYSALEAWRTQKIVAQWDAAGEDVRLRAEPERENYFDVYGEPDTQEEREEIKRSIDRDGCWRVVSEYLGPDGEWHWADSIGMIIAANPLDPLQNPCATELMQVALDAHETAWEEAGAAI
jgi:hypothetical protein